jgi:hypothetical protein
MKILDSQVRALSFCTLLMLRQEKVTINQYLVLMMIYYREASGHNINGRSYADIFEDLRKTVLIVQLGKTGLYKLSPHGHELLNKIHDQAALMSRNLKKEDFTNFV